jgi:hypothetical protein
MPMTKRALCLSLGFILACACSSAPIGTPLVEVPPSSATNPFWHADGEQIVDGNGERVVVRGVNVGGWLIWENWMWGGGWQGETTMRDKFVEAAGDAEADRFAQRVYDTFITIDDIGAISDLGTGPTAVGFAHHATTRWWRSTSSSKRSHSSTAPSTTTWPLRRCSCFADRGQITTTWQRSCRRRRSSRRAPTTLPLKRRAQTATTAHDPRA